MRLSDEQMAQTEKYWKAEYDLIYDKFDVNLLKAFIGANKVRGETEDGQLLYYNYDTMRKYKDAVLFGAKRAEVPLSLHFTSNIKAFLDSLKKENQSKKKMGQVAEEESDPITFPLYIKICTEAVCKGMIFLWVFTVLQWNCMARSINIDNLRFNCFSVGKDSIIIKFFDSKKDKEGKKTTPKNCFANPFNFFICCATALGLWLCLNDETYVNKSKVTIFLTEENKEGAASHKYCEMLVKLFKTMEDKIHQFCRPGHANAHGIRKGSAIEATSGTTCPPPPSSVARRGEWSLGKVFDIYWLFAEAGDQYCGRILAGLNPHSSQFEIIPPHFTVGMENEDVKEAMNRCFYNILQLQDDKVRSNVIGVLLRCLASIVHHSDSLLNVMKSVRGHPFHQVPILHDHVLLNKLKPMVITQPSEEIDAPTGVPPHVKMLSSLSQLLQLLQEERSHRQSLEDSLIETVEKAIERNALQNGNITHHSVSEILKTHQERINLQINDHSTKIDSQLSDILQCLRGRNVPNSSMPLSNEREDTLNGAYSEDVIRRNLHFHNGRYWHVPQCFDFPMDCKRRRAWELWLIGQPNYQKENGENAPIMPFQRMDPKMLPKKLANKYTLQWRPIMKRMMEAPDLPSLSNANDLTPAVIESSFEIATKYLQATVCSYVFTKYKNYNANYL